MYLKKIVLNGFKSFYSRTELEFPRKLTAIVGPNGCGKSNILDAVRWVLGEQSAKQLRGEQISDIISAGNARRGSKNKARAYLTFADCGNVLDIGSDEVEVGREVNQDGKGTYYLNGKQVRLKDIKDLFRDTGVGTNLYSIIGQGEVQELIKSKPEDRREIIEEAAGIATYRHRRDLTKRRLKQTREELAIVEKELREKRGRLGQLKGQAKKAREVREIRGNLRKARLEQARRNYQRLQDELDKLVKEKENARQTFKKSKLQQSKVEKVKRGSLERLRKLDSQLSSLSRLKAPVADKQRRLREELGRQEVRIEAHLEQMKRETDVVSNNRRRWQLECEKLENKYRQKYNARLRVEISKAETKFIAGREKNLRHKRRQLAEHLEDIRDRSLFQVSEESEVKHWQQQLQRENRELKENHEELDQLILAEKEETKKLEDSLLGCYRNYMEALSHRQELELEAQNISCRLDLFGELADKIRRREENLRQKLEGKRSRHQTLDRLFNQYEGFYRGVKTLMREHEKGRFSAIKGVVANLINVPSRLEAALQMALGASVQNIVIDRRSEAQGMIDFLKENKGGRVTFLPLDKLSPSGPSFDKQLFELPGVLGFAGELIDYDSEVKTAVKYLLGRVLVVESLKEAHRVYDSDKLHSGIIVTLEGEKIHPGGAISGGSLNKGRGELLTRSDQIERLQNEITELNDKVELFALNRKRLKTEKKKTEELKNQVTNALQGIKSEVREDYEQLKELGHSLQNRRQNYRNFIVRMADLVEKISKNRIELTAAQTVAGSIAGREAKRRRENQSFRKSLNTAEKRLEELQSDWRDIEKVLQSARSGLRETEMSIEQIEANRRRLIDENRSARNRWLELKKNRIDKEESKIQTSLELIRLKEELSCWEELQNTVTQSRHRFERELEEINDRLRNAETKVARTEGELKKIDNELENKKARGREQRQLLVEELEVEPDPEALEALETGEYEKYSSADLNKEIRKSKNRLRSLQPVNMLAGKEAEKLETEVSDIAGQKDDLEDSCRKLGDMIRRLNARARQQFQEAFSEIQDYFQDFVSELFKGGTGRLALTEGPVLEAGVNVEIEPPGEKLKNMSSLSGGEKTLAAIAFLFALFERKASPFCFLDEVDAPFDDENVAQMIGLLNRYSSDTQFVIITHNKSTMQAAEQLYGVTMEESGVTSIVRIDLSSADSFREKQEVG